MLEIEPPNRNIHPKFFMKTPRHIASKYFDEINALNAYIILEQSVKFGYWTKVN